ncbi:MAG: hypothetical protein ACO24D_15070 [bacterium]
MAQQGRNGQKTPGEADGLGHPRWPGDQGGVIPTANSWPVLQSQRSWWWGLRRALMSSRVARMMSLPQ